jgi:hypothetical protein
MNNNKFVLLGGLNGLMEETCLPLAWLKKMTLDNVIPSIKIRNKYYYNLDLAVKAIIKISTEKNQMSDLDLIIELGTERDEARKMYCVMAAQHMYKSDNKSTAEHIADSKNWDCYKTETQEETK